MMCNHSWVCSLQTQVVQRFTARFREMLNGSDDQHSVVVRAFVMSET